MLRCVGLLVVVLRVLVVGTQSAFLEGSTSILSGRLWLEQDRVDANVLTWACGSYPWFLLAGAADIVGRLGALRAGAALLGGVASAPTAQYAWRSLPDVRSVAPVAGMLMAVMPTAIGVGPSGKRFRSDWTPLLARGYRPVYRATHPLYLEPAAGQPGPVRIGIVAFDEAWRWRDDGFQTELRAGTWADATWDLPEPGLYREIGVALSDAPASASHISRVRLSP